MKIKYFIFNIFSTFYTFITNKIIEKKFEKLKQIKNKIIYFILFYKTGKEKKKQRF